MGEGDHAAVAGATGGVEVGGVHHPRADGAEQPDVVLTGLGDALEPQVHHHIGADLAVQGDDSGDIFEIEDVHRFTRIWPSTTLRAVTSPTVDITPRVSG